jgi:hypothetical protein
MVHDLRRGEATDNQDIEYGVSKLRCKKRDGESVYGIDELREFDVAPFRKRMPGCNKASCASAVLSPIALTLASHGSRSLCEHGLLS